MSETSVLKVEELSVAFPGQGGVVADDVTFSVDQNEVLGIVGESGSGKTIVGLSIMGLVPAPGRTVGGRIRLAGHDVLQMTEKSLRALRGKDVAMVFQDPLSALNPVKPVASPFLQSLARHRGLGRRAAIKQTIDCLKSVGIANAAERLFAYPHQFSGGQRQRLMIALALLNDPALVIADEPTTALDTTIQAQILELLKARIRGRGLVLITHDLGVAAELCERVIVMRKGRIIEEGSIDEILASPQDPYTKGLIAAMPRFDRRSNGQDTTAHPKEQALLDVKGLSVVYASHAGVLRALNDVDVAVGPGESIGVVGESGSGKSTLAKAILRIIKPTAGKILFEGHDTAQSNARDARVRATQMQLVFQDPYASLDPRWNVERIIAEPLHVQGVPAREIKKRVGELIEQVDLPSDAAHRLPSEFSGGQRQRICLARTLILKPKLVVADEPVSSLDVTVQRQITDLLKGLQRRYGIALMLIAHDLPLVYEMTDRVVVLYFGQIVEEGPTTEVLRMPAHPYTAALLAATPSPRPHDTRQRLVLEGEPPSAFNPPEGCKFHPRCPIATDKCSAVEPKLQNYRNGVRASCHYPGTLKLAPTL